VIIWTISFLLANLIPQSLSVFRGWWRGFFFCLIQSFVWGRHQTLAGSTWPRSSRVLANVPQLRQKMAIFWPWAFRGWSKFSSDS
jgi:hypothetical protein